MSKINLFSQIISKLDRGSINAIVKKRETDKHQKGYSRWAHLVSMLFSQLGQQTNFRHTKFRIKSKIFLLDSSTINLCLSLFDWAKYKTNKGAVKMHTLLEYDGNYLPMLILPMAKQLIIKGRMTCHYLPLV